MISMLVSESISSIRLNKCGVFGSAVESVGTHCLPEGRSVVWVALPHSMVLDHISLCQNHFFFNHQQNIKQKYPDFSTIFPLSDKKKKKKIRGFVTNFIH